MADTKVGVPSDTQDPGCESADYKAMSPVWDKISAILGGLHHVRRGKTKYLPKYEDESESEYCRRLESTAWRPEFEDGVRNLSAKPFQKDVTVKDTASQKIKDFAEDVDGCGNNLTRFAKDTFDGALSYGVEGILVDYPTMAAEITLADEKAAGARPYWVHLCAKNVIALFTENVGGQERIKHLRYRECYTEQDGYGEREIERIRVFEPGKFEVWESRPVTPTPGAATTNKTALVKVSEGVISLGVVPAAFFFTGKRTGNYQVKPPLDPLADMQIELYQALSRKNEVLTFAGTPMLKVLGVSGDALDSETKEDGTKGVKASMGPKRVWIIPPGVDGNQGDVDFIQPAAANITEIRQDIEATIENMRRLAMQPITDKSGNPTATGQAIDQAKAHSTLQSWALGLKDALEVAFKYTAQWMQLNEEPEVQVFTDFGVDATGVEEASVLLNMTSAGYLSAPTLRAELQRRDILSAEFDETEEAERIAEQQDALGEMGLDPITGEPIKKKPGEDEGGAPAAAA